ncbi:hypothetical protein CCP1ISM_3780001 [Azospirillaceae bacterium]
MTRILGLVVLAIGATLLLFGYQSWNAPVDQAITAVTGSHTDNTVIYIISGIAAVVGGVSLAMFANIPSDTAERSD